MEKVKKALNHVFIDGLSGMALGLFATLIIGTIIQQIGNLIGGTVGDTLYLFGKAASVMTSAGIGIGVAYKFKEPVYVTLSAATAGMVGGYASKILAGTLIGEGGVVVLAGPGEPLGAFIAAIVGIELGHLVAGKTKIDLLVTPFVTIVTGSAVGLLVGPPITRFMTGLGAIINWGTEQQPFLMGIVVSVLMGMILTLPISSAALGIILNLSGLAAGAAVVGCCCNMVGFAVASYRENKIGGLLAQGVGTSMLQVPNIVRKPVIWLPAIISSAILGTGEHPGVPYDQQCHGLRHGNRRAGGTDHDVPGDDRDAAAGGGTGGDRPHAFHPSGHHFACRIRGDAKESLDQIRGYEAGCSVNKNGGLYRENTDLHFYVCCMGKPRRRFYSRFRCLLMSQVQPKEYRPPSTRSWISSTRKLVCRNWPRSTVVSAPLLLGR